MLELIMQITLLQRQESLNLLNLLLLEWSRTKPATDLFFLKQQRDGRRLLLIHDGKDVLEVHVLERDVWRTKNEHGSGNQGPDLLETWSTNYLLWTRAPIELMHHCV